MAVTPTGRIDKPGGRGLACDVLVVGGGLGGVASALAACRRGRSVVLTEETDWIGGQLTAQAVPPDEHPWIERHGCTATYRALRDGIRDYYRRWYPLTEAARRDPVLNPGLGRVSTLCHEPRVALAVLEAMLAPHRAAGRLRLLLAHRPVGAAVDGDRVEAVTLEGPHGPVTVMALYVLDATETGALLPLTGTEHVTGCESRHDTGEPSAPDRAQPDNLQAATVCFVVDHLAGQDHTIDPPAQYAFWRDYVPAAWQGRLLDLTAPHPRQPRPLPRRFVPNPDDEEVTAVDLRTEGGDVDLWTFRRIAARRTFVPGAYPSDLCLVNWPQVDYLLGPLDSGDPAADARHLEGARELSLSVLHWLQTAVPRPDGGAGWPGLRLRGDVVGTDDGLAKTPYHRESRRIRARRTVVEQDLSVAVRGDRGATRYADTVGVGSYRIDLHPTTGGDGYLDVAAHPFQLPLGALLPLRLRNLLPAAKNIGTTHVTNGCYRLHPVEWNVGEVAGLLAAWCLAERAHPAAVHADARALERFQQHLAAQGLQLSWPAEVLPPGMGREPVRRGRPPPLHSRL